MKRYTTIALALYLAVLGTGIEARADCKQVRGSDVETIIPSPNDPLGRTLGIVNGVLNGASTTVVTSLPDGLHATSFDVFVTNGGDILTATGVVTFTPVPFIKVPSAVRILKPTEIEPFVEGSFTQPLNLRRVERSSVVLAELAVPRRQAQPDGRCWCASENKPVKSTAGSLGAK